ncbi:MAG: methylenetetrahydrofolate reductase [NAD(P)H] [Magnetococcales bacterium]|nr:methylenetetrahydrofolate reductase [NAD(P)H] [Magnetococcales bacterium]
MTHSFRESRPTLSFEFFPPKDGAGEAVFWRAMEELSRFRPDFVSVTYGAGGAGGEETSRLVCAARQRFALTAMPHLTCIGHDQPFLAEMLDRYDAGGVDHILALRGDRRPGMGEEALARGAFRDAEQFTAFIRQRHPRFRIGVAAYPEKHPEATSLEADLDFFQRKVDAGADFAITQFFFDNDSYQRLLDASARRGLAIPIIPGVIIISDHKQIRRFAELCGASLPGWLEERLEGLREDPSGLLEAGVEMAIRQCRELLASGAPGLHFFTLNRSALVARVLRALDYREA